MVMSRPRLVSQGECTSGVTARRLAGVLVRVVPTLFSGYVWLVAAALLSGWFPLVAILLVMGLVGGRRCRAVFAWRHGVRAATEAEAAAVWEALLPVQQLRGRGQPRVWIDMARRTGVEVVTHHDLAVPPAVALALLRDQADTDVFCAAVCWTFGTRKVRGDGFVHASAEVFWLPASILGAMLSGPARSFVRLPLVRTAWALRFIYIPMVVWHEWGTAQSGYAVAAAVVIALTYLAPWCQRCYDDELVRAGDTEVVRSGMGRVWAAQLRRLDASLATEQRAARLEADTAASQTEWSL